MFESFKKFKRKLMLEIFFKGLILGLSFGVLVEAVFYLLEKRDIFNLPLVADIAIAAGIAVVITVAYFFIRKPNDMQVAKRLDNQLGLHEKIQTMIAFKDKKGTMVELQRDDAKLNLDATPSKNVAMKFTFVNFALSIVAVLSIGSAVAVPEKKPAPSTPPSGEIGGIDYTEKIDQIKDWLNNEDIDEDLKAKLEEVLKQIEEILDSLQMTEAQKIEAIEKLLAGLKEEYETQYKIIGTVLMTYKADYSLYNLGFAIYNQDQVKLSEAMQEMLENVRNVETTAELQANCYGYAQNMQSALKTCAEQYHVDREDKMYKLIEDLMQQLYDIYNDEELANQPQLPEKLVEDVFYESTIKITDVTKAEVQLGEFVDMVTEMTQPTEPEEPGGDDGELPPEEEPYVYQPVSGDDGDESFDKEFIVGSAKEDATGGYGAGIGTGDVTVAKNEKVYDPITNSYVSYGDIIKADDYYATYILNGLTDGNMPEDVEAYIYAYYMLLYYGKSN